MKFSSSSIKDGEVLELPPNAPPDVVCDCGHPSQKHFKLEHLIGKAKHQAKVDLIARGVQGRIFTDEDRPWIPDSLAKGFEIVERKMTKGAVATKLKMLERSATIQASKDVTRGEILDDTCIRYARIGFSYYTNELDWWATGGFVRGYWEDDGCS